MSSFLIVLPNWRDVRGSGTVMSMILILIMMAVLGAVLIFGGALYQAQRIQGIANTAALGAADAARGLIAAEPCQLAREISSAHGVMMNECRHEGVVLTVGISTTILGLPLQFLAQAGPPR